MDENLMPAEQTAAMLPVGEGKLKELAQILNRYKSGKARTEQRIISAENWWKLRNGREERSVSEIGRDGGFESASGWLHNVIVSKHADAMEAYPEPNILPREQADKAEAKVLSSIIPCILEQNRFEEVYSTAMWQKMKSGTGVYKVWWDPSKLNGLGDIAIECINPLNIYWEPGVTDIQRSPYIFHVELHDKQLLREMYPQLKDQIKSSGFSPRKYNYDDSVNTADKAAVIDVYYRRQQPGGKTVLHHIKYCGNTVLTATENEPNGANSLYEHGRYPYVFDPLFPIEGSPCGYGFVDIGRNPQTEIDLLKTAFVKNAMVGATPRYFRRQDGGVNEDEFLDLSKPLVNVDGNLGEDALRLIQTSNLDGNYMGLLDRNVNELRETTGNTETAAGNVSSGVTAASAIAALQEASGKGSRDSTRSSYIRYSEIVTLCIELIRQFYDMPRQFRITGKLGQEMYISYTNQNIKKQMLPPIQGMEEPMYRLPVFDIKVSAQKRNVYTKVTQNELALQFFKMGFFTPQMSEPALMCLDMMEFDGREELMQKIGRNGNLYQMCVQFMQLALAQAKALGNMEMVQGLSQKAMQLLGMPAAPISGAAPKLEEGDNIAGTQKDEPGNVEKARKRAANASQPGEQGAT